ncbi:Cytochrome c-like domain containing protein [Rhabdaerophilaceae bacterium]
MMKRFGFGLILLVLASAGAFWVFAHRFEEIPAIAPLQASSFAPDVIKRGEQLAGLGACETCHTKSGGQAFAGGRSFVTPFGTVYATNITPDRETGIGTWSEAAFLRAMREGIDRQGRHLYPVFPYDHFTKVREADLLAIYAYLMTRPTVSKRPATNQLSFPFNMRFLLAGWNLLFLERGALAPVASKSEAWNTGAYLVAGLGHCGACHSPRNALGAIETTRALAGGEAQDWYGPPLGATAIAPVKWTKEALINYLVDGWDADHGVAAGPMIPVVNHLAMQPEDASEAIATYLAGLVGPTPAAEREAVLAAARARDYDRLAPGGAASQGEQVFARACASCHRKGATTVPLALGTTLHAPDARNALDIVMNGIKPPNGAPDKTMPRFASSLSDSELVELMGFLRSRFAQKPAWPSVEAQVKARRQ